MGSLFNVFGYMGMMKTFYRLGVTDIDGNKVTEDLLEAMSNTYALSVERFDVGSNPSLWHMATALGYGRRSGSKGTNFYFNNSNTAPTVATIATGRGYAAVLDPSTLSFGDKLDTHRPTGGSLLPWDKTGRQYRMYNYRGKTQDVKTEERYDPSVVIADPTNAMTSKWGWQCTNLYLALRNPEKDLLNPSSNQKLDLTDEQQTLYATVSTDNQVFILNTRDDSNNNQGTNFAFKKLGGITLPETLEAEDATFNNATVGSTYTGASSGEYVQFNGPSASNDIQWSFTASGATSDYAVEIHYSNGISATRKVRLYVNGIDEGVIDFPGTGSWSTWTPPVTIPVDLVSGTNTIKLVSTSEDSYRMPIFDKLSFSLESSLLMSSSDNFTQLNIEDNNLSATIGEFGMTIYPNPTDSRLNLMISNGQEGKAEFSVVNALGVMVKVFNANIQSSATNIEVDVASLAPGVYTLQMRQGGNIATSKLIIN